jgi:beta-glucanase (GH16 family)
MRHGRCPSVLKSAALSASLLLVASASAAAPTWTLVWSDDFIGGSGAPPDPTRWTYDVGGGGWGNGELETYTNSTANSYQDGAGHLVIQALNNGGYTSARLKTQGLFDQAYGRVEASIQLPAGTAQGSGLWPAFWMLGSNINTVSWPACGEIDIMENIGQYDTATQNLGHVHGPVQPGGADYYGGEGVGTTYNLPAGQAINTAFHLYAVEWNPTSVTYYVDGTAYQTITAASLPAGGQWVFNHPFFIILNLAIGGAVGGPVGASFPQQMLVDYVRVYKLTSNGTTAYGGTPPSVPGTILAANYDSYNDSADPAEPGEGFAYNALNGTQTNGVYRTGDAISTENCSDTGGGYDCDYTSPGQWMQYTMNVDQAGSYDLDARVASSGQGGSFHFDVDGTQVTGEMTCPDTGGWQSFQDVVATGVSLTAGSHQLLLVEDSMGAGNLGVCNFHYYTLSLPAAPTATPVPTNTPVPTSTPLPTVTSVAPTATPGGGTLAPLQSGMQMTCQFANNTNGAYSNSQIYVVAIAQNAAGVFCHLDNSGNLIPCVSGENGSSYAMTLAAFNALQFPATMTSGRLYVSLGTALNIPINTAANGSVGVAYPNIDNPSDPNINTTFDWIELAVIGNAIWCNTTQVDMFGIPMELQLYTGSATSYSLYGSSGITECSSNIFSEYSASVPAAFAGLAQAQRIVAPIHGSFGTAGANAGYFDAYINSVWTQYATSALPITMNGIVYTGRVGSDGRLAFTDPGDPTTYYVSKPATNDVWGGSGALATGNSTELALEAQICAAFHRHVIDNAANLNNPSAYYQAAPADYYSQFWHKHSTNALAYGFCYDDVNNQSSTLSSANPRGLIITVGGGACASGTATPNPTATTTPPPQAIWRVNCGGPNYTDTAGNLWVADCDYTGGTVGTNSQTVSGSPDNTLYQTERYGNPFTYTFNVPAGTYQVTLKESESYWTAAGQRVFNVSINGTQVLTNFDIFASAGGANKADDQLFNNISPSNGQIVIQLGPASVDNAKVDAIQIIPMPKTPTPTGTPSQTASPSNTASPSPTSTISPTPTRTGTPTWTAVPSATLSDTPSPAATKTSTPTSTAMPTATLSNTPSPAATKTSTPTSTAMPTDTLSNTPSPADTKTSTPTSTAMPTATLSNTPSPAATKTSTAAPTVTVSGTTIPEPSKTATATPSATPTVTSLATDSPTQVLSPSFSATSPPSATETATAVPSSTPQPTDTPAASATRSPSPAPSPSPSPLDHGRRGGIVQAGVAPNPNHGDHVSVFFDLDGYASQVEISLFSTANVLVMHTAFNGSFQPGWNKAQLPALNLPNGLYFVKVSAGLSSSIAKLLILR